MNAQGNIWLAVGKRKVGKTHTAMTIAEEFFYRDSVPKSIIVFDHTNNSSYNKYNLTPMTINQLTWLDPSQLIRAIVRSQDIDLFVSVITNYGWACSVLFDDIGALFRGNLTLAKEKLLKTPSNNGTELIFQAHRFAEISPSLLAAANMYIIKQTVDDPDNLPQKLICEREIRHLLIETIKENYKRPSNQKWATRVYDTEDDEVWLTDKNGNFEIVSGEDYFPFSAKKRYGF